MSSLTIRDQKTDHLLTPEKLLCPPTYNDNRYYLTGGVGGGTLFLTGLVDFR
jgi:hypothetical protein